MRGYLSITILDSDLVRCPTTTSTENACRTVESDLLHGKQLAPLALPPTVPISSPGPPREDSEARSAKYTHIARLGLVSRRAES